MDSEAACVRYQSNHLVFKGIKIEVKTDKPSHKCWSNVDTSVFPTLGRSLPQINPSNLSLDNNFVETSNQVVTERPKQIPGKSEEYVNAEDMAFNIVDNVLDNAKRILATK